MHSRRYIIVTPAIGYSISASISSADGLKQPMTSTRVLTLWPCRVGLPIRHCDLVVTRATFLEKGGHPTQLNGQ